MLFQSKRGSCRAPRIKRKKNIVINAVRPRTKMAVLVRASINLPSLIQTVALEKILISEGCKEARTE
jgi:hypothetical protein